MFNSATHSLKRLQTDYVDVLFLHNIVQPEWATYEPMLNFLAKMQKEGKARAVGISFHEGSTLLMLSMPVSKQTVMMYFWQRSIFKVRRSTVQLYRKPGRKILVLSP